MKDAHPAIWAWRQDTGDAPSKLVLLYLAQRADKAGLCWPNATTISKATNLGYSTVRKALDKLVALGVLVKQTGFRENGSETSSRLYLTWRELVAIPRVAKKRKKKKKELVAGVLSRSSPPAISWHPSLLPHSTLELSSRVLPEESSISSSKGIGYTEAKGSILNRISSAPLGINFNRVNQ